MKLYANRKMTRAEAEDRAIDLGLRLSDRDADGRPIAGTARVNIAARGDGFDAIIPIELVAALYDRGYRDGAGNDGRKPITEVNPANIFGGGQ